MRGTAGTMALVGLCLFGGCSRPAPANPICEAEKARAQHGSASDMRLPLGLAVMPGARLKQQPKLDGSAMGAGVSVVATLETDASLEMVADFYRGEFRRIGAKIDIPEDYPDLVLLHGQTRDGGYLMVNIDRHGRTKGVGIAVFYQSDCL